MTALDRQVAERRGLRIFSADEIMRLTPGGSVWVTETYSPSTNLLQAFQLWEEARPDGCQITTYQCKRTGRFQVWWSDDDVHDIDVKDFADLPRAITQAWVEARVGR